MEGLYLRSPFPFMKQLDCLLLYIAKVAAGFFFYPSCLDGFQAIVKGV